MAVMTACHVQAFDRRLAEHRQLVRRARPQAGPRGQIGPAVHGAGDVPKTAKDVVHAAERQRFVVPGRLQSGADQNAAVPALNRVRALADHRRPERAFGPVENKDLSADG